MSAAAYMREAREWRHRAKKAEALIEEIRKAMGGYPDSDLVSLATTLKVRDGVAEKAEARVEELQQQLLMAASALDAGKDGCQFVRVMDDNGKFICMAEIHRGANQSVVPLLEMSARVGVRLTLEGK